MAHMEKKINFRFHAKKHFEEAKIHLSQGDEGSLISAALRMRMAIECLAYELLQSLGDEVSENTMETWQPGKLIKELKKIDASIENSRSISIGVEKVPGVKSEKMESLGTDTRLSAAWINRSWNALGSYLHEPTIRQHKEGKAFDKVKVRAKIEAISGEVDKVLSSTLFATNLNVHVGINCECGFHMVRRQDAMRSEGQVTCAGCGALWKAFEDDGEWIYMKLFHNFVCPICSEKNNFPAQELYEGSEFTCKSCGSVVATVRGWRLNVISDNSSSG